LRKFEAALLGHLAGSKVTGILDACRDPRALESMPLHKFMGLFTA
jgi:2-methylcitrate dehydratase